MSSQPSTLPCPDRACGSTNAALMNAGPTMDQNDTLAGLLRSRMIGPVVVVDGGLLAFVNHFSLARLLVSDVCLQAFDRIYVDGISQVLLLQANGLSLRHLSFDRTSLAPAVPERAVRERAGGDVFGSRADEVEATAAHLSEHFEGLDIVGAAPGWFDTQADRGNAIARIVEQAPEIVVVGMGAVNQERFLLDLRAAGFGGTGYTCGGSFHQTNYRLETYPPLIDKFEQRAFYRMWREPALWRRYLLDYPQSLTWIQHALTRSH